GPSETKYVEAITKLIQRDIEWLDLATASPPSEDDEAGEEKKTRSRRRGSRDKSAKGKNEAGQETTPRQSPKKGATRRHSQADEPRHANNDDGPASFSADGHIPAFLLRPAGKRA